MFLRLYFGNHKRSKANFDLPDSHTLHHPIVWCDRGDVTTDIGVEYSQKFNLIQSRINCVDVGFCLYFCLPTILFQNLRTKTVKSTNILHGFFRKFLGPHILPVAIISLRKVLLFDKLTYVKPDNLRLRGYPYEKSLSYYALEFSIS